MLRVNSVVGLVGIGIVALGNVPATWAQVDDLPRGLRESVTRTQAEDGDPSAAAAFDTEVKITASDGAADDIFGRRVAISGDTAIVGARHDDDNGTDSGSAYLYGRNVGGADNWGEVAKISASDGTADDWFGFNVAIDGDTAIVGAREDDDNGTASGSAYVYGRNVGGGDNWGEVTKIVASDGAADDGFGHAVAINGDTAIVAAAFDDDNGTQSGSVYVYGRNVGGTDNWGEVTKIIASDGEAQNQFGVSVALNGDTAIMGADQGEWNVFRPGSAYLYGRNVGGTDNWGEVTKITASDGATEDRFGIAVALNGDTVIVGAFFDDDNGTDSGSAYIYGRNVGGTDNWGGVAKITASDGAAEDQLGLGVAISGDTAIVGARLDDDNGTESGSVYVYERNAGGTDNWGEVTKITASDAAADDRFGIKVAISGGTMIVGAPRNDDNGADSGSAYIYSTEAAAIPTVSEWGLVVMALLVCTVGTIVHRRRLATRAG